MRKNVLALTFFVTLIGIGMIIPTANYNPLRIQSPDSQPFTMSAIGDNTEDYVDQVSNLHAPTDIGTHSAFDNLKDYGLNNDAMTEGDTGGAGVNEYRYVDAVTTPTWTTVGTTPYLDAQDQPTNYIYTTTNALVSDWYEFGETSGTGSGFTVNCSVYWVAATDSTFSWEIDWTDDGTADASGGPITTQTTWGWTDLGTITGLDTQTEIDAARIRFTYDKGGAGPDQCSIDAARIGISQPAVSNYELDLEVGWTAADYDESNEELCIYPVTGGGWPTEDIKVDVWNGAWTNVIADLTPDQWNNVSISSYLTGTAFEIRFLGGTETGDTNQDTWEIDAVLIHTWTPSYAPAIDQAPTLDNPSDTDNMYAQYMEYQVTVYVSDQNGFADIDYLEIGLWDNTQTTEYCRFRYDEDTNTFTEEYDAGTYVSLNTGSSTATESGNDIDATFYFTIDWDFPDSTDLAANCSVIDTQTESATAWYGVNWDVETRLEYSVAPSIDDASGTADRGDLDGSFSLSGTIIYYTSIDDYPASTTVDVWVSASEYGTDVGPWSDLTLTSGAFDVTCYADDAVGQDTYTVKVVEEGAGSGGTDLYYTTSATDTYIADRVQVQSYSVSDDRVNINDNVDVDVTLYYDYDDSTVTDGTVTINGASATHQGSGVWRITDSESAVMANTYDTVAYTGGTHGITTVDQNGQSQTVIWDEVIVVSYSVADNRVDINTVVNVDVTLQYDYDNSAVTDGTVTINGISASDQGSGVWRITPSQSSVTAVTYNTVVVSGNTHGITSVNQNSQSQQVIWDQVIVISYTVADTRVDINTVVNVDVTLQYDYDNTAVTDGTVTINGNSATHQGSGVWRYSTSQSTVQQVTYDTIAASGNTLGITSVNQNGQSTSVIWDRIGVQTTVVDDNRVGVGTSVEIRVTLWLEYDSTPLGAGDSVTLDDVAMTWDGVNLWFDLSRSQASVGLWTYFVNASTETGFGITTLNLNSLSVSVIWDQVQVQSYSVVDNRVNINDNVNIDVTLYYDYDDTAVTDGTVTINGLSATHQGSGVWRVTDSKATVQLFTYDTVAASGNTHGISVVDQNAQTQDVIWDRVQVQTYSVTDSRVNINDVVNIDVTLYYDYDNTAVTDGTVTINGDSATHQGSGVWRITDSETVVMANTYNSVVSSGNTHGVSAVDQNSQSQQVIWDQITVRSYSVADTRVNINDVVNIDVTIEYEYDDTAVTDGTVTINGASATHQGAGVWRITDSESSVMLNTYDTVACSGNTEGITSLNQNSQSIDVIWDQVQVQSYTVVDSRVNVSDSVDIDVTLYYDYDNTAVTDGTVTINGASATHQGSGVWRLTDSEASVIANTYNTVSVAGNTHGITTVDQNGQSQQVIWDQVIVVSYSVTDSRVDVSTVVNVDVSLQYDYDNSAVTDGTVTINGLSATHQGSGVWRITPSQVSVTAVTYNSVVTSGNTYGISSVNQNGQSQQVIWDQITVRSYSVSDPRANIGDTVNVDVTIEYEYDDTAVTDGTVTINGFSATHQGLGVWRITDSEASVMANTYDTVVCSGNTEDITSINQNSQSVDVIWDRVQVQSYSVTDSRIDVNTAAQIDVTLYYDYDNSVVTDGTVTINGISATHQGAGVWRISDSKIAVQLFTYDTVAVSGNTHGITVVDQNSQSQDVIWDRIQVQSYSVTDNRVNINDNVNIDVTLYYDYDDSAVIDGTVSINGYSATHQGSGVWRVNDARATVQLFTYDTVTASGNTLGITVVDQNGQSQNVIWDRLVIVIGVDEAAPLNGIQANFTLTVTFDYDDSGCTTYQLAIDRNSTWWHSFTDSNQSLFVDMNTDTTYNYVVRLITSESTYDITAFTSNTQQVVWAAAPNVAPTNDAGPILTNPDDTDNMYARYRYYIITSSATDTNGYTDIDYVELSLYDDAQTAAVWTVRYTVAGDSFSIQLGSAYIDLHATSFATPSGNSITITWIIKIDWDHADLTDIDTRLYVDDGALTDDDYYESNWDVETRLSVTGLSVDDGSGTADRGDLDGSFTISGTLIFYGSVDDNPLSNETDVWISASEYGTDVGPWSDLTLTTGQFSLTVYADDAVGQDTYTVKAVAEGTGAGGTDLLETSAQDTYIADRIQVQFYSVSDDRANLNDNVDIDVTLYYEYDSSQVTDGTATINGFSATHQGSGVWRITDSEASVMANTYDTVVVSGNTHGINSVNQNSQSVDVIWDRVQVQSYSVTDSRIDVNTAAQIDVTLYYDYDDSAVTDGTVTINGISATHQGSGVWRISDSKIAVQLFTYNTVVVSGNTHGITTVDQNSQSVDVIWDRIQVQSYSVSDDHVHINDNVNIDVTLFYDYDDSAVIDGTVSINGYSATHQGSGVWRVTDSKATVQLFTYDTVAASGNTLGITVVDQHSQSKDVIWDRLVVVIGVDEAAPLNGIQANFTLTVTFDYDDSVCTTYQLAIDRNSTWWHSFTNTNKSLFVDTNTDTTYNYVVRIITSEATYDITAFTSNTQQVVWAAAPNVAPTNDAGPILTNPDDTDNMYARYRYYVITSSVTDNNGYTDIDYVELSLYDDAQTSAVWTVRYTVAGDSFSVQLGGAYIDLHATSFATPSGNSIIITWIIKIDWSHADLTDIDTRQYVDDGALTDDDYYESNWDVETRLSVTGLSVDDGLGTADRGDLDGSFTISGTLIFYGSVDDSPFSNETDVWVSASEYGTTTGPWSDLTLTTGQFSLTAYADDAVGLDTYTVKAVAEGDGAGGTDLLQSTVQDTYIADRVQVQSYSVADDRVNVDATVNIDVTLYYEYDSSTVTDGTVSVNGLSATHQGSGVWRVSDVESTVMANTYDTVVYSGGTHTLTGINQNGQSQTVIWDQIVVQTTVADDTRVDVGANVEIRVTLWLAYDSSFLGSGDSVTLDGTAMTWDGVNSWFNLTVSQASVGLWTYFVNSSSDATYGISVLDLAGVDVDVIWDQVRVQSYAVSDDRVNLDDSVNIDATLTYAYDSSAVTDGTVTINGLSATHQGSGVWRASDSQSTVQLVTYDTVAISGNTYGISSVDQNLQTQDVIWDRIQVQSYLVSDDRVNMNANVNLDVTLVYDYDNTAVTDGTVTINGVSATHQAAGVWRSVVSESTVTANTYNLVACSSNIHGISTVDQNGQSQQVIWDQITVRSYSASDTRVNVGDTIYLNLTIEYEYDDTPVTDGTVSMDGIFATHQENGIWQISDSEVTVWMNFYHVVVCASNTYGISSVNQNGQSQQIVWDSVLVVSYSVIDDRVNINDNVNIDVTIRYAYDSSAVTDGTMTINGLSATHQGAGVWRITDSKATVQLFTYDTVTCAGNTYGITVVNQNSQTQDVIWDQVLVQSYSVIDARVNLDDSVDINVTLVYSYDSTSVTDGTVTINGLATTHLGSGIWRATDSKSTVQLVTYDAVSASGNTYGITSVDQNSQTQNVIWDRVQVQSYGVSDTRVNIDDNVDVDVTLYYDYDNTAVTDGTVTINAVSATHQGAGVWRITVSESTVTANTYNTVAVSGNTEGITTIDQNSQSQQVIWDQITVRSYSVIDTRVDVSVSVNIDVTIEYEYDDTAVTDGTVTINGFSATHQGAGVWRVVDSEATVVSNTYDAVVCSGNTEGITSVNQNSQSIDVIWDRIQVQSYSVSDSRVGLNDNVNIDVTIVYDYDNSAVTDGTVTINGFSATHQGAGVWRLTDSEASVMLNTYNIVACSGNGFGLSVVDQNSQSTTAIWDQLIVTIGVDDSTPLNDEQANFTLAVIFDYDDLTCATYQIVIQRNGTWWHSFTDSNKSLFVDTNSDSFYTYTVQVVTSESTYNVLAFSTNSQQVVWSPSPNIAPVNVAAPILTNPDDTDNMYARYVYYTITSSVSDGNGYTNISYVELTLYDDSRSSPVWTVRYTVSGGVFSIQLGSAYITLSPLSYAIESGNDIDITWIIKIDWDHADMTDVDTYQYVRDAVIGVGDFYESNWNIETRLDITGLTIDDGSGTADRGPLDGSLTVSGTVIFFGSVDNYPLSNETDVWVSSSEYGTTIGPWSDLTLTSGQFSLTAYADDAVGQDTFTVKVVVEAAGAGGVDLLQSTMQDTYIADRILVQGYTASDPRVNIGDTVDIDVELVYAYDFTAVTDGTVTVNGLSATHQGSGFWRFSDTKASVQLVTFDTTTYSGGTHGLTQVDQAAMSQDVIWDQIVVQTTLADDTRVNVGDNVEIRVTLWLAYDSSFLGSGDSVTLDGVAMTWNVTNSWFDLTVSQASVGLWSYFVNSSTEATYGITSLDLNSQSVDVIWDQIVVQTTVVDNSRLNVNANAEIRVTLWLDYDNSFLGSGDSVTLDGSAMTWDGVNSWFDLTVSQSSVGAWLYFVNSTADSTYGITSLDLNSQQVQVIWDEIVVQTTVANDSRVNMGANVEIRVTLWLAYDSTYLGASDSVTLDGSPMTWDGVNSWFDLTVSQASIGLWTYFVNSSVDSTYGITALNLNSQSVDVVWDRIVVQTTVVSDGRVDVNTNAEIHVTLLLEYDSTYLGAADSVTLDGTAMTWDGVNSWFELNVSQSSVGLWTYFVNSSTDSTYAVDLLDLNGNLVSVIWDRVQVQSYAVLDNRVNVGDSVDIDVTLIYDYDDSPVTDGTITVNGLSATHQVAGVWRVTDSEASVIMNTYNLVVASGNTHGLSVVDQNSQTQDVIWDRLVIVIGVDDASSLNGHQANFTLTVTFDYDDVVCTTYQIAIDRNSTWWHSFIDGNVSFFVDTNTDSIYLYSTNSVTSESTYGITAFTSNTLQVVWSLAPNELPVNDSVPVLTNGDDTDYLYARYRYYVITTSSSDPDGYADINYVELTLYSDDQLAQYWTIRYTVGTGFFSVESGGSVVDVGAISNAIGIGYNLTITWYIKIDWTHADVSATDIFQYVYDGSASASDFYETNWNVETRLDYSVAPSLSGFRGDINTADLVATGSVTYYGSSLSPLNNETDVWVLHDIAGTWNGDLSAGSFTVSNIGSAAIVRLNTYTFKVVAEGAGSGGTDLYYTTSPTDDFITDRIEIYEAGTFDGRIDINTDCEVWWRARYEYDSTEIQSGLTIVLNGSRTLLWDAGNLYWSWQESSVAPALVLFDVFSASESTYGLTQWIDSASVQQVIWDSLVITISDPTDQRINVGANASGIVVSAVYSFDGASFDGIFTLNNTNFVYMTPQRQDYTVLTATGDSFGITAIGTNDVTFCIWDRVRVVSIDADELYHDPNDDVNITVELQYEYDGSSVLTGTFAIASYPLTHVGAGVWAAQVTIGSYQAIDFDDLTACDATLHGISEYNMDSNVVTVYWDRLEFYSVSVDDDRISVGDSTDVEWSVRLENAGISIPTGVTAQMTGAIDLVASAGVFTATVTESEVGSVDYSIISASLGEIGQFIQSASDATVIWDTIRVTSITATQLSVDASTAVEIHVTLVYEFDSTPVTSGEVRLRDGGAQVPMVYNSAEGYWSATVTKTIAGNYTFEVDAVVGDTHGITELNAAGLSVEVEWVAAPGFVLDTMTLMLIGGGAGIGILGLAIVASRRRGGGGAADLITLEPTDLGVPEPVEVEPEVPESDVGTLPEAVEPEAEEVTEPEPESIEEPEVDSEMVDEAVEPEEVELPPVEEELGETEVMEEAIEAEPKTAFEVVEPDEVELPPAEEDLLELEALGEIPESEPAILEEPVVEPEIDMEEVTETPEPVEEPIVEPDVEPEAADYTDIPEEFIEPEPVIDLSTLTKNELLDMIPADIRETTSPNELRRLTKQELISLIESFKE